MEPVFTLRGVNDNADLILGANENSTLGDNGVITSDPAYTGSDIYIRSNDLVQIQLDDDNNTTNSSFFNCRWQWGGPV